LIAPGGEAAICARISEGSIKKAGDAGWLHILGDFKPVRYEEKPAPKINWNMWMSWASGNLMMHRKEFSELCRDININPIAALQFFLGYHDGWLLIPLYNERNKIAGIQKRKGKLKRFVKNSRAGVFLPLPIFDYPGRVLAVTEGWTDTVIARLYGFNAIGKFNCLVGDEWVSYYVRELGYREVIIFSDRDEVGRTGAEKTKNFLKKMNKVNVKVVVTPEKDLKACYEKGKKLSDLLGNKQ